MLEKLIRNLPFHKTSEEVFQIIIHVLLQQQFRGKYGNEDVDIKYVQIASNHDEFWDLVKRRFRQNFSIKSKRTSTLFKQLGFEKTDTDDDERKRSLAEVVYCWIREQWQQRFGAELPELRPLYNGVQISLSWLLLELLRPDEETPLFLLEEDQRDFTEQQKQDYEFQLLLENPALAEVIAVDGLGESFLHLLHYDIGMIWPPQENVLQAFSRFFMRLVNFADEVYAKVLPSNLTVFEYLEGIPEVAFPTFTTVACPDYEHSEDGVFTFNKEGKESALGNGIGLVPQHVHRAFIKIWRWAKKYNLHYFLRFKVIIADIEAYSEHNLVLVKETKESFLEKCRQSNQAFFEALPLDMQEVTETMFLTEVLGGSKDFWDDLYENAHFRVESGDWQDSEVGFDVEAELRKAFMLRRNLYKNWIPFDPAVETEEEWEARAYALFCEHVAQHIVTGNVLTSSYTYVCNIQGETHHLRNWLQVMAFTVLPVFYTIRRSPQFLREGRELLT